MTVISQQKHLTFTYIFLSDQIHIIKKSVCHYLKTIEFIVENAKEHF